MSELSHRHRLVSTALAVSALLAFASTGCAVHHHHSQRPGAYSVVLPPRYAAHGYVHHYRDVVLVFDRSWNGYWVRSHPDHYYHSGHYYRRHGNRWHRARRLSGPWVSIELGALPTGLRHRTFGKERRHEQREVVRDRRAERRDTEKHRRVALKERRDEQREVVRERRAERRDAKKQNRAAVKERRDATKRERERAKDRREEQREAAPSAFRSDGARRSLRRARPVRG